MMFLLADQIPPRLLRAGRQRIPGPGTCDASCGRCSPCPVEVVPDCQANIEVRFLHRYRGCAAKFVGMEHLKVLCMLQLLTRAIAARRLDPHGL